ncbi:MAG: L-2-amino-thiazoline-4-carboxylic acid hydrolase [Propionicimonas sp.]
MTRLTKSIVIDAPVGDVFDFLKDPAMLQGAMPHTEVREVKRTPGGVGTTAEWEGRFLGLHVTGNTEYTELVPNERLVLTSSKGFVFSFALEPADDGTKLTLVVEDVPSNWIESSFDAVAMKLTEPDLDGWLTGIKAAVEGQPPGEVPATSVGPGTTRLRFDPRLFAQEVPLQLLNLHTTVLTQRFGARTASVMRREILQEYRTLIPGLPDLGGGSNPESMSLMLAPWALALYRVVQRHGGSLEDAGEVIHYSVQRLYGRIPHRVRLSMGRSMIKANAEKKARWFAEHSYPDNFKYQVVDGDGQPFDFGLDATQCAIVYYLHAQQADELTPYLCDLDYVLFEALGVGLTRTKTLAWGCDRCDFRVTNPGKTTSTWPPLFAERACGLPQPSEAGKPTTAARDELSARSRRDG